MFEEKMQQGNPNFDKTFSKQDEGCLKHIVLIFFMEALGRNELFNSPIYSRHRLTKVTFYYQQ